MPRWNSLSASDAPFHGAAPQSGAGVRCFSFQRASYDDEPSFIYDPADLACPPDEHGKREHSEIRGGAAVLLRRACPAARPRSAAHAGKCRCGATCRPGAEFDGAGLPDEIKHLWQALPFMLEESLLDDVDALHFAHKKLDDAHHAVVIDRETLTHWVGKCPSPCRKNRGYPRHCVCRGPTATALWFSKISMFWSAGGLLKARGWSELLSALLESLQGTFSVCVAYGRDEQAARGLIPIRSMRFCNGGRGACPRHCCWRTPRCRAPICGRVALHRNCH